MEVGVEQLVHGRIFRQPAITGDDPVAELEESTSTVWVADVLHQVRRNAELCFEEVSLILLQVQEHQKLTVAEHRLYRCRRQQIRDVLRDCRAEAAHLSYLSPDLLQISRGVLIVRKVCR